MKSTTKPIPLRCDVHRTADGKDMPVFIAPAGWWIVPGPASGPPPAGGPQAGIHAAGAPAGGLPGVIPAAAGAGAALTTLWRLLLIAVSILAIVWTCTSCAQVQHRDFKLTAVGADMKGVKTPEGLEIAELNTSNAWGIAERTADKGWSAWKWGKLLDFGGDVVDGLSDVVSDNNATDVQINKSNNATQQAVETFVPPEPVVP